MHFRRPSRCPLCCFQVPFTCEDKFNAIGAKYTAGAAWNSTVAVDGKLVTGQNPQSAKAVAEAVIAAVA